MATIIMKIVTIFRSHLGIILRIKRLWNECVKIDINNPVLSNKNQVLTKFSIVLRSAVARFINSNFLYPATSFTELRITV